MVKPLTKSYLTMKGRHEIKEKEENTGDNPITS